MILKMLFNYTRLCWGLQTITTTEVESEMIYGFWMFMGLILDIIIAIAFIIVFINCIIPWVKNTIIEFNLRKNMEIQRRNLEISRKDKTIYELTQKIESLLKQH